MSNEHVRRREPFFGDATGQSALFGVLPALAGRRDVHPSDEALEALAGALRVVGADDDVPAVGELADGLVVAGDFTPVDGQGDRVGGLGAGDPVPATVVQTRAAVRLGLAVGAGEVADGSAVGHVFDLEEGA